MSEKINLLHLSDIHFGIEKSQDFTRDQIDKHKVVLKALVEFLKNITPKFHPQIVVITGDVGFFGTKDDYQQALTWITDLRKALNLESVDFFICPGNHDRDLNSENAQVCPNYNSDKVRDDVDKILTFPEIKKQFSCFSEFSTFCRDWTFFAIV